MARVCKGFVNVPFGQVHYRHGGAGPVVVMLHDSPRSSVLHAPNIEWLGEHYTVLSLDTPGYGLSSPLPIERPGIADFSAALAVTLAALGIDRCAVYGFHTSSKMVLRLAVDHPERVALAVLDGLSLPERAATEEFLRNYLIPFEVTASGSHLATQWTKIRDFHRFFPWFEKSAQHRIPMAMPDDPQLHLYATDVFMAGPAWTGAYGAALRYLAAPDVPRLQVPTVFLCREDDVLYGYLDRLPDPLPAGSRIERIAPDTQAWRERLLEVLRRADLPTREFRPADPLLETEESAAGGCQGYVSSTHGQLRVRRYGQDHAPPLLLLHEPPGGSVQVAEVAAELARDRLVIAPDLPGNGESDPLPDPTASAYAAVLADMMGSLGIAKFDVHAEPLASAFAIQLAVLIPERVGKLVLDGVTLLSTRQRAAMKRRYAPPVTPCRDGTHLHSLWHMLRDTELNWPWYSREIDSIRRRDPDLSGPRLNARLVETMKQLAHYGDASLAAIDCPVAALLPLVSQPTLLLGDEADVRYRDTRRAARLMVDAKWRPRPAQPAAIAAECLSFLAA